MFLYYFIQQISSHRPLILSPRQRFNLLNIKLLNLDFGGLGLFWLIGFPYGKGQIHNIGSGWGLGLCRKTEQSLSLRNNCYDRINHAAKSNKAMSGSWAAAYMTRWGLKHLCSKYMLWILPCTSETTIMCTTLVHITQTCSDWMESIFINIISFERSCILDKKKWCGNLGHLSNMFGNSLSKSSFFFFLCSYPDNQSQSDAAETVFSPFKMPCFTFPWHLVTHITPYCTICQASALLLSESTANEMHLAIIRPNSWENYHFKYTRETQ